MIPNYTYKPRFYFLTTFFATFSLWFAVNFFVSIIPLGIIISWICLKNRKSILAAILFHFIINISQEILNITQTTKCIETVVLTGVAAVIIFFDKKMFFSTKHLSGRRNTPVHFRNATIHAGPSASKDTCLSILNSTELVRGNS